MKQAGWDVAQNSHHNWDIGVEFFVHAIAAECAFKRADHGVRSRWRQIFIAAFAAGP